MSAPPGSEPTAPVDPAPRDEPGPSTSGPAAAARRTASSPPAPPRPRRPAPGPKRPPARPPRRTRRPPPASDPEAVTQHVPDAHAGAVLVRPAAVGRRDVPGAAGAHGRRLRLPAERSATAHAAPGPARLRLPGAAAPVPAPAAARPAYGVSAAATAAAPGLDVRLPVQQPSCRTRPSSCRPRDRSSSAVSGYPAGPRRRTARAAGGAPHGRAPHGAAHTLVL